MILDRETATRFVVRHMARTGFHSAHRTSTPSATTVELVATGAVAALNHGDRPSRARDVRRRRDLARGRTALLYSVPGYSRRAVRVADRAEVALFALDAIGGAQPRNRTAARLVEERRPSGPPTARTRPTDGPVGRTTTPSAPATDRPKPDRTVSGWAGAGCLFLVVIALLVAVVVGIELFESVTGVDLSIHDERTVSSAEYRDAGRTWPFRVDSGTLACRDPGYAITFTVDDIVYAVSDVPDEDMVQHHWFPATEILAAGLTADALRDVQHDGRTLCHLDD